MNKRRGMTLLEVMWCVTFATALLSLTALVVSRTMRASARAADHREALVVLDRLGEQFRRDVHAAGSAVVETVGERPVKLRLADAQDEVVEYEIAAGAIRRVVTDATGKTRRDSFAAPGFPFVGWRLDLESRLVTLDVGRLARTDGEARPPAAQFEIVAALGPPSTERGRP